MFQKKILEPMVSDLMGSETENGMGRPLIIFYSGNEVAERIVKVLGPTTHEENEGLNTIRRIYGNPADPNWRNIAHAPKPKEVQKQLDLLRKYRLA